MKSDELAAAVFEALGEASVCWEHIDQAGIFDSTRAGAIGDRLVGAILGAGLTPEEWRSRCNARKRGTNPTVITEEQSRLLLYGIGIGDEAGEVLGHVKKHVWHDQPLDRDYLLKEVGDVLWYADQLLQLLGLTMQEALAANDAKLNARHPGGWSPAYHDTHDA
jgi:NTP pyrophosphatase (non-canonical NTP hydrolase)